MKKTISTFLLALLGLTIGLAHAADPTSEITESADPAKAQAVEAQAAQIRERAAAEPVRRSTVRTKRAGIVAGAHKEAEVDRTMRRSTVRQKRAGIIAGAHQEARDARQQQQQQAQPAPAPAPAAPKK